MDIIWILLGAIIGGVGFINIGGALGIFIGILGIGGFIYGLVINHLRHQQRECTQGKKKRP